MSSPLNSKSERTGGSKFPTYELGIEKQFDLDFTKYPLTKSFQKLCINYCEQCGDCLDCYAEDICPASQVPHYYELPPTISPAE